jgi:hypothetical protein
LFKGWQGSAKLKIPQKWNELDLKTTMLLLLPLLLMVLLQRTGRESE